MYEDLKRRDMITSYNWKDYGFGTSVIKTSIAPEKLQEVFKGFWIKTYVRPRAFLRQIQFLVSGNRFRRAMAKQYVKMAVEMISDVKKMSGEKDEGF